MTDLLSIPVVNINGTSRAELIELRKNTRNALKEALNCLALMRPHGRDYQTVSHEQYTRAVEIHKLRETTVKAIADEIYAEAIELSRQGR